MTIDILRTNIPAVHGGALFRTMIAMTVLLAGRAMTLTFVARSGDGGAGDPPAAWLMPLIGDAVIGVTALGIAWILWRKAFGLAGWAAVIVWNAVGIWDALSAYLVNLRTPWPEFFMLEMVGPAMFFAASAMHAVLIWLATRQTVRQAFFTTDYSAE